MTIHRVVRSWAVVLPTALILVLALVMTSTTNAAPVGTTSGAPEQNPSLQTATPECKSCHEAAHAEWETSTHAKAGASCESCHGQYKEGHPAGETMLLPMESETCRACHTGAFAQWEDSRHADKGIDCFDCHQSHTQGLRPADDKALCASCHNDEDMDLTHATHGLEGLSCNSCHMDATVPEPAGSAEQGKELALHTFLVGSQTCLKCHQETIHTSNVMPTLQAQADENDPQGLVARAEQVPVLEQKVTDLTAQISRERTMGLVGAGLTLGMGGFLGLIIGVAVANFVLRGRK